MNKNNCNGSVEAQELHALLVDIASRGYIKSDADGPRAIGTTLETLLGIDANSSTEPDYKGIEIKASMRAPGKAKGNRQTLFSKVPDWKRSAMTSGKHLLLKHGRHSERNGKFCLYHELSVTKVNSYGLQLRVNRASGDLEQVFHNPGTGMTEVDVVWSLDALKSILKEKHRETFFVKGSKKVAEGGGSFFQYETVFHTRSPLADRLEELFEAGILELDYTLSQRANGTTRDHGYLFKIHPDNLALLFPEQAVYQLRG